jgi:hypothetical protein
MTQDKAFARPERNDRINADPRTSRREVVYPAADLPVPGNNYRLKVAHPAFRPAALVIGLLGIPYVQPALCEGHGVLLPDAPAGR